MLDHFLAVGGNEVVNSERAYGYATTADCAVNWLEDPECETISDAEGHQDYVYANIADAPWYDPDDPDTTSRFLGLYGVDIRGLSDSTREATVTQKNGNGAVVSGYRHGPREVRVRGWMTARGGDALEAGMTWLRNVLEPNACGMHGGSCGQSDSAFFVDCPPERRDETLYTPWATAATNRALNPSFEAASGSVELRRNLATDPRGLSTAAWSTAISGGAATLSAITGQAPPVGVSTGIRSTATVAGTYIDIQNSQVSVTPGQVYSFGLYARYSVAGASIARFVQWLDGSNAVLGTNTAPTITTYPAGAWNRYTYENLTAVPGAVKARFIIRFVAAIPVGATLDVTGYQAELGATLGAYFDGALPASTRANAATTPIAGLWLFSAGGGAATAATVADSRFQSGSARKITFTAASTGSAYSNAGGNSTVMLVGETWTVSARYAVDAGSVSGPFVWLLGGATPPTSTAGSTQYVDHGDGTVTAYRTYTITSLGTGDGTAAPILTWTGASANAVVSLGDALWEKSSTLQPWFSGDSVDADGLGYAWNGAGNGTFSYQYELDYTPTWTGAANASVSTLTGAGVANVAGYFTANARIQSSRHQASGKSLRVIRTGASPQGAIVTPPGLAATALTVIAKVWVAAGQTVQVGARTSGGSAGTPSVEIVGNGAWQEARLTATPPSGQTLVGAQFIAIGANPATEFWVDDLLLVEGDYSADYFDGSTLDGELNQYAWTGTANASTSTWQARTSYIQPEGDATYLPYIEGHRRFLHSVRCISGPFEVEYRESRDGLHVGRLVEFTLLAEVPWVYGKPKEIDVPPLTPTVMQDVAYNLVPYPSAELPGAAMIAATNHVPNPSVEVNDTGYALTIDPLSSPNPATIVTSGRNNDIAAAGSWSYRTRLDASTYANDWGGTAYFDVATPSVGLGSMPAGSRLSFSVWAAALFAAGAGTPATGGGYMHTMAARAVFTGGAGGTVPLATDALDYDGTVFSKKSVAIPTGATSVRIYVRFELHWSSTSPSAPIPTATDVRCYVDAVAVTTP